MCIFVIFWGVLCLLIVTIILIVQTSHTHSSRVLDDSNKINKYSFIYRTVLLLSLIVAQYKCGMLRVENLRILQTLNTDYTLVTGKTEANKLASVFSTSYNHIFPLFVSLNYACRVVPSLL